MTSPEQERQIRVVVGAVAVCPGRQVVEYASGSVPRLYDPATGRTTEIPIQFEIMCGTVDEIVAKFRRRVERAAELV